MLPPILVKLYLVHHLRSFSSISSSVIFFLRVLSALCGVEGVGVLVALVLEGVGVGLPGSEVALAMGDVAASLVESGRGRGSMTERV